MSYNKVILQGNCGADPVVKEFEGGSKIASFSLATTQRGFTLKDGRVIPEKTDWHNIVVRGGLAKVVEGYVHKGTQLLIDGEIHYRSYDNKEGQKVYLTEIHVDNLQLLGGKPQQGTQQPAASGNTPTETFDSAGNDKGDGDLPF